MSVKASRLLEGSIFRSLLLLAIPIVLANMLQSAYQLTDAFWVGRLGGDALAAVSVSFPVVFLLISLGIGFAVAGSTLIAQYVGAGNQAMVDHVAAQTLLMVTLASLILGGVGVVCAPFMLKLMGVTPQVYGGALGFMRYSFVGLIFTFGFAIFQSVMRGVGEVTMPLYIVLGTVILNFVLDPLLIFGWGPIPGQGVMGAAQATLFTQGVAAAIGLIVLFGGKYGIHVKLGHFKPDPAFIRRAFVLGFPASIEQSTRALGITVLVFIISSFGTLTVAAYGVGTNILQFVIIPAMGLSMAIATLVGQNIGANNIKRAEEIARLGAWISFVGLSAIGLLTFLFAREMVVFFVPGDTAVIEEGSRFVRIMSFSFGFMALQLALTGVFRAAGKMMATMIIALVSQWVLQFPLAYILSKHTSLGVEGLWWSFPVSSVLTCLITLVWYVGGSWKEKALVEDDELAEQVMQEIIIEEGARR